MRERISVSTNFFLDEFVDPYTYFKEHDSGLSLVDPKLFAIVQALRNHYKKSISINNWWKYYVENIGKKTEEQIIADIEKSKTLKKWSGIRTTRTKEGASLSAHRTWSKGYKKLPYGQAIDPKSNTKAFYKIVENNLQQFYDLGLRRLEDPDITPGWLHMDTLDKFTSPDSIRVVGRAQVKETLHFTRK